MVSIACICARIYTVTLAMEQKSCDDAKLAAALLSACFALVLAGISAAIVWNSRRSDPPKSDSGELLRRFRLDSESDSGEEEHVGVNPQSEPENQLED